MFTFSYIKSNAGSKYAILAIYVFSLLTLGSNLIAATAKAAIVVISDAIFTPTSILIITYMSIPRIATASIRSLGRLVRTLYLI